MLHTSASVPPLWQRLLAALTFLATSPLVMVAAIAVKFSSQGPALHRASRVGAAGEEFTMLKLRTMHQGSEARGLITTTEDDRIFPVGRALRRLKVDELPQLINVVRGEMAFVGPRPEDPVIVERHYAPWMYETLTVPPGIVGPGSLGYFLEEDDLPTEPAAAERYYVDHLLPRKLSRDLVYVRDPSTRHTLSLLLRTVLGILGLECLARSAQDREDQRARAIYIEIVGEHP